MIFDEVSGLLAFSVILVEIEMYGHKVQLLRRSTPNRFVFVIYFINSICISNLSKHYSEFATNPIHPKTSEIMEVKIPDNDVNKDKVDLEVEDGEEKKEEDDNIEVSDEYVDGKNDDNDKDSPKKT